MRILMPDAVVVIIAIFVFACHLFCGYAILKETDIVDLESLVESIRSQLEFLER